MSHGPILRFVALWQAKLLLSDDVPGQAAALLLSGLDSGALRQLAGLIQPRAEAIEPLVRKLSSEAGLPALSTRDATLHAAAAVAEDMLSGRHNAYDGARRIWSLWYEDFPEELMPFVGNASQIEDFRADTQRDPAQLGQLIAECEADIIDAARRPLSVVGT